MTAANRRRQVVIRRLRGQLFVFVGINGSLLWFSDSLLCNGGLLWFSDSLRWSGIWSWRCLCVVPIERIWCLFLGIELS